VILPALGTARAKGRDVRRVADLKQIQTAIEMYYTDNGYYPPSSCGWDCNGYFYSANSSSWNSFYTHLSPYISKMPVDPINSSCYPWVDNCHSYVYGNVIRSINTPNYDLMTQLEDKNNSLRCEIKNYKIALSGGTSSWCGPYSKYMYDAFQ